MPHEDNLAFYKRFAESHPVLTAEGEDLFLELRRRQHEKAIAHTRESLEAMITLYGGERVAKWVRDLTFLIERKELP